MPPALSVGPVVAATEHAAKGDTGAPENPWTRFCAGGEIASTTAAAGVAASVVQQVKYVSVIRACRCIIFLALLFNVVFFCVRQPPSLSGLLRGR
jgi:hypothetical protein